MRPSAPTLRSTCSGALGLFRATLAASALRPLAGLGVLSALAVLSACSGLILPPPEEAPAPPAPAACCASLVQVPDAGLLRDQRVVTLNRASSWFELGGALSPVTALQLPLPRGEASLDLVALAPAPAEPGMQLAVALPKLVFLDGNGQVLPSRLQGPRPEQAAAPQLRWTVDVPLAAERVVIGLDVSRVQERLSLNITEPGLPQFISGIRVDGAPVVTPVDVRVTDQGQFRLFWRG